MKELLKQADDVASKYKDWRLSDYIYGDEIQEMTTLISALAEEVRCREWKPIENYDKASERYIMVISGEDDASYYPEVRRWSKYRETWVSYPDGDANYEFDEQNHWKFFVEILPTPPEEV